jgi:hypothetical protein
MIKHSCGLISKLLLLCARAVGRKGRGGRESKGKDSGEWAAGRKGSEKESKEKDSTEPLDELELTKKELEKTKKDLERFKKRANTYEGRHTSLLTGRQRFHVSWLQLCLSTSHLLCGKKAELLILLVDVCCFPSLLEHLDLKKRFDKMGGDLSVSIQQRETLERQMVQLKRDMASEQGNFLPLHSTPCRSQCGTLCGLTVMHVWT